MVVTEELRVLCAFHVELQQFRLGLFFKQNVKIFLVSAPKMRGFDAFFRHL